MVEQAQVFELPESQMPSGAEPHAVKTPDGVTLRALSAPPAPATLPRGTVVIMNGRAEFLERYYETMRELAARGFHVVGFDWRGQGGSSRLLQDRLRGHIRSFRQYDSDLCAIMENLVVDKCPPPYFALAHSTGGHILLRNLASTHWFQRAIITAPLLDFRYGKWPPSLAYLLSSMAVGFGFGWAYLPGYKAGPFLLSEFEGNPLTSEVRRWGRDKRMLQQHPDLGTGGPTYGWFNAAVRSIRSITRRAARHGLTCPVLVVLAGREKVVDNRAAISFIDQVPGISSVTINSALHEIMMESDAVRAEFFAAFDSFVGSG
jgi:lysophospholipase